MNTQIHHYQLVNGRIVDSMIPKTQDCSVKIRMTAKQIKIGCAIVDIDVVKYIMQQHEKNFKTEIEI